LKTETITVFQDYLNVLPDYEKHLHNLYALRDIIGRNNFSLQSDGTFQIMHYVGFFQKGNTRIQILPKIYSKTDLSVYNQTELTTSMDFLYRLLYWSGFLNHEKLAPQLQSSSSTDLLEIFIGIFITEFIELFSRKINRNYIQQEENQQFVKGKILFSETIRRNPLLRHLHYVRFDEYTINNPLNQIFKSLMLELLTKSNSSVNKRKLVIGLTYLQEVDLINLSGALFKQIRFDRLNTDFEPLFNLAKLFFHNSQPGLSQGKEKTFSFLVPVHLLFENFVAKVLDSFTSDDFEYCYHHPQLHLGKQNGENVFLLEPDFTIQHNNKVITILDTKFKYPFDKSGNVGISTDDLYQLIAYAVRYNCKKLFLIYPKFFGEKGASSLLAEYKIESPFGEISLRVIQIDIMNQKLSEITERLKGHISPIEKLPTVKVV
jgi:5-methylcytosine-specific restriction enzyme subunit McrC